MKIFLDDVRPSPNEFILVRSVKECIYLLENNKVEEISLDHDLGSKKTGYDIILYIEKRVFEQDYIPPKIKIHSANISARLKMMSGIKRINKFIKEKKCI